MLDVLKRGGAALSVRVTDEDLVRAAQTEDHLRIMRGLGCASCVMVPMMVRGEILGVISLMRGDGRLPYGKGDVDTAEELAHRAALAIDNARLYREARRREGTMRFFAEASTLLSSSLDHVSICERLAHLVVPSFADWCGVELAEEGELRPIAIAHVDSAKVEVARQMRLRYPPDAAAAQGPHAVLRTGRSELIREVTEEMVLRGARNDEHLSFMTDLGAPVAADRAAGGGRPPDRRPQPRLGGVEPSLRTGGSRDDARARPPRGAGGRKRASLQRGAGGGEAAGRISVDRQPRAEDAAHQPAAEGGRNPAHHRQAREGTRRSGQADRPRSGGRQAARTSHRAGRCAARRQPRRLRTAAAPAGGRRPRRGGPDGRRAVQGRPRFGRLLAVGDRDGADGNEESRSRAAGIGFASTR